MSFLTAFLMFSSCVAFDPAYVIDEEKRDILDSTIRLAKYYQNYDPKCFNYTTTSDEYMCVECYKRNACEGLTKSSVYLLAPSRGLRGWNYTTTCDCNDATHLFLS